jgi:dihydroorotase
MSEKILIKNARMINEGVVNDGDLLVRNGRIERIDTTIQADDSSPVLDAGGCFVLPGMIDDQVHFREPGLTHKAGIWSESRAAVAGGITSFMEMPNTLPPTVTLDALEEKYSIAARKSLANYAFYLGATNDNLDVIRALDPAAACGVKVFMGASTGNMLVDDEDTLAGIFREAPTLIATHCESTPLIQENMRKAIERYGREIPVTEHQPAWRSPWPRNTMRNCTCSICPPPGRWICLPRARWKPSPSPRKSAYISCILAAPTIHAWATGSSATRQSSTMQTGKACWRPSKTAGWI